MVFLRGSQLPFVFWIAQIFLWKRRVNFYVCKVAVRFLSMLWTSANPMMPEIVKTQYWCALLWASSQNRSCEKGFCLDNKTWNSLSWIFWVYNARLWMFYICGILMCRANQPGELESRFMQSWWWGCWAPFWCTFFSPLDELSCLNIRNCDLCKVGLSRASFHSLALALSLCMGDGHMCMLFEVSEQSCLSILKVW
jgi:hypothetical protein